MRASEARGRRSAKGPSERSFALLVMAGLVPAIHVLSRGPKDVDARDKPGHDVPIEFVED
jgi:hypothetical protein